jgi:hypothetical protein
LDDVPLGSSSRPRRRRLEAAAAGAFAFAAASLMIAGEVDEVFAIHDRALAAARRRGDVLHAASKGLAWRGRLLALRGELGAAVTDLRVGRPRARRLPSLSRNQARVLYCAWSDSCCRPRRMPSTISEPGASNARM